MIDLSTIQVESAWSYGWKTTRNNWNDDAVWTDVDFGFGDTGEVVPGGSWNELRYPAGHSLEGNSIDLTFVIVPEPATMSLLCVGAAMLIRHRRRQ